MQALKGYLAVRLTGRYDQLFLNHYGEPISERGVEKLITRYVKAAGIKKK
jgi:site-specific recombinase XerD